MFFVAFFLGGVHEMENKSTWFFRQTKRQTIFLDISETDEIFFYSLEVNFKSKSIFLYNFTPTENYNENDW